MERCGRGEAQSPQEGPGVSKRAYEVPGPDEHRMYDLMGRDNNQEIMGVVRDIAEAAHLAGLAAAHIPPTQEEVAYIDPNDAIDFIQGKVVLTCRQTFHEYTLPVTANVRKCRGVPREGCDYLSGCDAICTKCGHEHSPMWALPAEPHRLNSGKTVVVSNVQKWTPVGPETPMGCKVQLINKGANCSTHGHYDGKNKFWTHWAPLPSWE